MKKWSKLQKWSLIIGLALITGFIIWGASYPIRANLICSDYDKIGAEVEVCQAYKQDEASSADVLECFVDKETQVYASGIDLVLYGISSDAKHNQFCRIPVIFDETFTTPVKAPFKAEKEIEINADFLDGVRVGFLYASSKGLLNKENNLFGKDNEDLIRVIDEIHGKILKDSPLGDDTQEFTKLLLKFKTLVQTDFQPLIPTDINPHSEGMAFAIGLYNTLLPILQDHTRTDLQECDSSESKKACKSDLFFGEEILKFRQVDTPKIIKQSAEAIDIYFIRGMINAAFKIFADRFDVSAAEQEKDLADLREEHPRFFRTFIKQNNTNKPSYINGQVFSYDLFNFFTEKARIENQSKQSEFKPICDKARANNLNKIPNFCVVL